jgi:GNAT superfamily N-acetyltransferase
VTIRLATPDDADALGRLHVAAWRAAYRGLMPDRILDGLTVEARAARWRRNLTTPLPDTNTWVATDGDALTGFVSAGPCRDADLPGAGEVLALYVDPARLATGLGRRLLEHALASLRERGLAVVALWVLDGNARAERFYARAGLAPGTREAKVVDGDLLPHTRWTMAL